MAAADELQQRYRHVRLNPDILYTDEGQVLTSAGLSAGIDLCLHMVRLDFGAHAAAQVARRMVVAVHRSGGQAQYARTPLPDDGGIGATLEWAISQMQRPLTVGQLARHAGMPVRTFTRQFTEQVGTAPMRWLNTQRVLEAQRLLEATTLRIDDIAEYCGFGSAGVLRTQFARHTGYSPQQYRRRHNA